MGLSSSFMKNPRLFSGLPKRIPGLSRHNIFRGRQDQSLGSRPQSEKEQTAETEGQGKAVASPFPCRQAGGGGELGRKQPAEAEVEQFLPRPLGAEASGSPLGCPSLLWLPHRSSGEKGASLGQARARREEQERGIRAGSRGRAHLCSWPCHSFGALSSHSC